MPTLNITVKGTVLYTTQVPHIADNDSLNVPIDAYLGLAEFKQAEQEPVAWKHDCAALCTNGVELWVDRCPHCGKPSASPQPVKQEPVWSVEECDRVVKTLRYIQGIAERGFGRAMREDETIEQFVLGYVKQLEAAPVRTKDLTDAFINELHKDAQDPISFARAVIAPDREKNK